jgi:chromate transporter
MNPAPDKFPLGETAEHVATASPPAAPTCRQLASIFFMLGLTSFGGMWGSIQNLEDELVTRRGWLTREEQQALMVTAVLIPAPKFLAFGSMVGYRLAGWRGSLTSTAALIAPGALLVLLAVILLNPDVIGPSLKPLQRAVGIGVVGLLFGNAYQQLRNAKVSGSQRTIGVALALAVAGATIAGVPLLIAATLGFAIGAYFIRKTKNTKAEKP